MPLDTIVQDWFYWPEDSWGSHASIRRASPIRKAWSTRSTRSTPGS